MRGFIAEWDGKKAYVLEVDSEEYGIDEKHLTIDPLKALTRLASIVLEEMSINDDDRRKTIGRLNKEIIDEVNRHADIAAQNRDMLEKIKLQITTAEYLVEPWKKP